MDSEMRTDSPRGGFAAILAMALLVIGLVVVFGSARPRAASGSVSAYYGPVTGHEFAAYLGRRHDAGAADDASFHRAMELAEAAGDRSVVEVMRQRFAEPVASPAEAAGE